ncbi:MAG: hypothetical protein Q7T71_06950, partial [Herbiconiux sp.]|nr:hypothetical protein [Herbiconiux sp.]
TVAPEPPAEPEPTAEPLPPAEGEDPAPSGDWTVELVYQACLSSPDADPANPIVLYGSQAESRVEASGPGYWLAVIPVTRSSDAGETAGQQVCYIDGTPAAPNVSVAAAL